MNKPSDDTQGEPPARGAVAIAAAIVAGTAEPGLAHYARGLEDPDKTAASLAARVVEAVAKERPGLVTPHVERLIRQLGSPHAPVVRACADTLPELARVTPARVAKHSAALRTAWGGGSDVARDGILRTWVALCSASIAYQARLVGAIEEALESADPKALARWAILALPALKGEPHAQTREVVERRLAELPRPEAHKLADKLGIRLRASRPPT